MGRILFEALVWTWMLGGSAADRSIENWRQSQSPGQDQSGDTEKNGRHCVWETCDALSYEASEYCGLDLLLDLNNRVFNNYFSLSLGLIHESMRLIQSSGWWGPLAFILNVAQATFWLIISGVTKLENMKRPKKATPMTILNKIQQYLPPHRQYPHDLMLGVYTGIPSLPGDARTHPSRFQVFSFFSP